VVAINARSSSQTSWAMINGNNSRAKLFFHRFVWNRHICPSSTCIVWTSMSCALFRHECHIHVFVLFRHECCMYIHVVYTRNLCTWLPCSNNAWHSCLNNTNIWKAYFTQIWNEPMKHINLWWCWLCRKCYCPFDYCTMIKPLCQTMEKCLTIL
jgi:hypothetical protein